MTEVEQVLDMRGRQCPEPVIETRKALETSNVKVIEVLVDNDASLENVARTARSLGCDVNVEVTAKGEFRLHLTRTEAQAAVKGEASCCGTVEKLVVLIPSDRFGEGDPDLGRALIQAFIGTLSKISPLPRTLIFLNAGARLVCEETKVVQEVQELVQAGCRVLVCGTCLDFYGIDKDLKVGEVSNMFEIASELAAADKIIRP